MLSRAEAEDQYNRTDRLCHAIAYSSNGEDIWDIEAPESLIADALDILNEELEEEGIEVRILIKEYVYDA